jgi:hypothetical protein
MTATHRPTTLERAYEIAREGRCRTWADSAGGGRRVGGPAHRRQPRRGRDRPEQRRQTEEGDLVGYPGVADVHLVADVRADRGRDCEWVGDDVRQCVDRVRDQGLNEAEVVDVDLPPDPAPEERNDADAKLRPLHQALHRGTHRVVDVSADPCQGDVGHVDRRDRCRRGCGHRRRRGERRTQGYCTDGDQGHSREQHRAHRNAHHLLLNL